MPHPVGTPIVTGTRLTASQVQEALRATGGNVSEAARELGVHRTTLHRAMSAYGIRLGARPLVGVETAVAQ